MKKKTADLIGQSDSSYASDMAGTSHLFKQVLEASGVAMSIRNHDLRPIFANKAFTDFYGYSIEELRALPLEEVLPEDTFTLNRTVVKPRLLKGESWEGEYVIRTKSGRLFPMWGRFDPVVNDEGKVTHIITIMRDASATRRLRNALSQTERHLHFLADNTSDCLFRLRLSDGKYDYISSAVESITGYAPQEFYETPRLFERISPREWVETFELWWSEFLVGKTRYEYESPLIHKDGSEKWVNQRIAVVKGDDGKPVAVEGIITDVTERRKVQEDLASAEKSLNFMSKSTSDIFFRMTVPEGRYEYLSPSVERFSGYTLQEYEDNPLLIQQIFHPDWAEYFAETWEEIQNGIVRPEYEFQYVHKSGEVRWARQRIVLHTGEDGKPIAIEGIASDATAHKRAEVALKANEEKYRFLAENITDVVWTMDDDFNFLYATPSVEVMWGYTQEELLSVSLLTLFTPEAIETFQGARDSRAIAESKGDYRHVNRLEMEHIRKDGERIWAETVVRRLFDDDGNPSGYQGVSRDITERKRVEQAIQARDKQYSLLVENVSDVVWTQDNSARFTYATPSVEALWGYTPEELPGLMYMDLFTEESRRKVEEAAAIRRKAEAEGDYESVNRIELEIIRKDGSLVWTESDIRRLLSDDGEPKGFLGVTRDVSHRKASELAIQENESRYKILFEESPISLWEEDLTRLKAFFDELKEQGVTDFRSYFYDNPQDLAKCGTLVDVVGVNKATLDLLRAKDKEDLLGNLDKVLTESSMAAFTEEMILLASGGCEYCGEITHRTLEGEIIWVVVHFIVPPEYQDTLSRVIVSLLDVTPRKRAEQALMDSEERYRVLVENAQEGVVVTRDGVTRYINEAMTDIFGYSAEELRQLHPLELTHPDDKAHALEQLSGYVSGEMKDGFATFRVVTKLGQIKWLTLNVKPIMWEGEQSQLEILTDVTTFKAMEDELRVAHSEMEDRVKKRTVELSEANTQLQAEVEEREKAQEHILSLTQQLIRVQEDERQRIARDLHDNVAQDLSSIVLKMETLFDDHPSAGKKLLERGEAVADILRGAIASVRDIAYGLRPPALDQLGLVQALANYCQDSGKRFGIEVDFYAAGIETIELDFDTEINIYRMVQEAIANVGRHSQASRAIVRIVKSHPDILIRIEDNGQGFAVKPRMTEAVNEKRMGLRSMEERARLIGGSMEVQSLIGSGTRVVFKIPIETAKRSN